MGSRICRVVSGEALFPNLDERAQIAGIRGLESRKVGRTFTRSFGFKAHGREFEAHYVEGGLHFLEPASSREAETLRWCSADLQTRRLAGPDDFERGTVSRFPCTGAEYEASFAGGWFALKKVSEAAPPEKRASTSP